MLNLMAVFGLALDSTEEVPSFGAKSNIVPAGNTDIELLTPVEPDGPCARALESRGPGMHHICLEVDDLQTAIRDLVERGLHLVDTEPVVDGVGRRVWLHPRSGLGVLFGIMERHPPGTTP